MEHLHDFDEILRQIGYRIRYEHECNEHFLETTDQEQLTYYERLEPLVVGESTQAEILHARQSIMKNLLTLPSTCENIKFHGLHSYKIRSTSGVRLGISSANASDNYTFCALEPSGGRALNLSVWFGGDTNDNELVESDGDAVSVTVELRENTNERVLLVLERQDHQQIVGKTMSVQRQRVEIPDESRLKDRLDEPNDPFRLALKALLFCGICSKNSFLTTKNISDLEWQLPRDKTLAISICSQVPNGSGFATSSAVALNLLNGLFRLMYGDNSSIWPSNDSDRAIVIKGLIVWLFENECGLRSGRQDVDAPLAGGCNSWIYGGGERTQSNIRWPFAIQRQRLSPPAELYKRLILCDTGIRRSARLDVRRGLNMRHLTYTTKMEPGYSAIIKSLHVHDQICDAFIGGHCIKLGKLLTEYMNLRHIIDPTALSSPDDTDDIKWLQLPFSNLLSRGLIYGGSLSGAMGGGIMMLIASDDGLVKANGQTKLEQAVDQLKAHRPLCDLKILEYHIRKSGLFTETLLQTTVTAEKSK